LIKSIVISGASGGLGEALAACYAEPGVTLGLLGRNAERLEKVAASCRGAGARVETGIFDVRNVIELTDWLVNFDTQHPVDLIVANAGVTYALHPKLSVEPAAATRSVFETNFLGVIDTVGPLLEKMQERGRGQIAVIGSLSAYRGIPLFPAYAASKAALQTYFEAVRGNLRATGIEVSIFCPGFIDTPMTRKLSGFKGPVLSSKSAAKTIKQGIEKRVRFMAFPVTIRIALLASKMLPPALSDLIYQCLFRKTVISE